MKAIHCKKQAEPVARNMYVGSTLKRFCDLFLAGIGLLLFAPIYGLAIFLICIEDRGPALFRQARLGLNRREFMVVKLRTMNAQKVTHVGRWLRTTGIDEVTQFVNVLRGEMSLVGPRPLTREDVERLGWSGISRSARFGIRPGITGLAQLFGGHSPSESYRLDLIYLKRATLWLDLQLVLLSIIVNVIGKKRTRVMVSGFRANIRRYRLKLVRQKMLRAEGKRRQENGNNRRMALPIKMEVAPALGQVPRGVIAKRHVLLINPFYPKDPVSSFGKHVLTPTLALTSIAGATPAGWQLQYWDENLLKGPPPTDPLPEVVGMTVHLTFAQRAYELADWYKKMGVTVVLGGLHVVSCPDEASKHADAIAIGDGVHLWPQILNDLSSGRLEKVYRAPFCKNYREDPMPNRQILPRRSFLTTASINATRGCHNKCRFCYMATDGLRQPYSKRDVEQVVAEIRQCGESYVVFTDNNLGSDKAYLHRLAEGLRPLNIIWSAAVSIDVTDDPALIRAMALSGCTGVFVGFESLSDQNLADAHKKTPLAEDYARRVGILHDNGIQVNASFVFGFDHDDVGTFARTVNWIETNRIECATFHILTPYPGTPLFRELDTAGRLVHKDWNLYDTAHAVFRPKHMTTEQLEAGYAWAYQRLFAPRSIWKRRPADMRAVVPYLAMSVLYKKANWLWRFLIRHDLTKTVWAPLVELTRRRHLQFRKRPAMREQMVPRLEKEGFQHLGTTQTYFSAPLTLDPNLVAKSR